MNRTQSFLLVLLAALGPTALSAQGTAQDYARSDRVRELLSGKVLGEVTDVFWIDDTHRFWYRRTVEGGHDFVLVDADVPEKGPAFDHQRLAAALSEAIGESLTAVTLPFDAFEYVDGGGAVEFEVDDRGWRCDLDDYACSALEEPERPSSLRTAPGKPRSATTTWPCGGSRRTTGGSVPRRAGPERAGADGLPPGKAERAGAS